MKAVDDHGPAVRDGHGPSQTGGSKVLPLHDHVQQDRLVLFADVEQQSQFLEDVFLGGSVCKLYQTLCGKQNLPSSHHNLAILYSYYHLKLY